MSAALPPPDGDAAGVYIISSDCMRCGICEHMCPVEAIVEAKRQLIILKQVCTGCGECVPYCPIRAIVPSAEFAERQELTVSAMLTDILSDGPRSQ